VQPLGGTMLARRFVPLVTCLAAAVALALLAGCSNEAPPPALPRLVKTVMVDLADASDVGSITGEIKPRYEIDVGFRVSGKVRERLVDVGALVAPNQVLARLDDTNERNTVRIAESSLAGAKAELADAEANEGRQRELVARGSGTQANFDAATRRLKTAQANVASTEVSLKDASERLGYTELRADDMGVITAVGAQSGQVVAVAQMVVRLARTGEKEALFNVAERLFRFVPHDPPVEVSLLSEPSIKAQGRVREVAPSADPVTRTFAVRIALVDPPMEMRLGSAVVGRVLLEARQVAALPPASLFKDGDKPAVWLFDPASGAVTLRQVGVLRYENDRVLVNAGLANGDRVVVAGVQKLRPGQKVRLLADAGQ
jgi:RND family efflux transporter MFP subunit